MGKNLNSNPPHKNNKFLFDLNNFDIDNIDEPEIIEEEIEIEPPPPTFSQEEMEAAKTIAHTKGVNQGHVEEKQEREQKIAEILKDISDNFSSLFAAETYREKQYEEEALKLGLEIISILAPSLNDRLGHEALKSSMKNVLKRQTKQTKIKIEVSPEFASDITEYIDNIWLDKDSAPLCKVVANSDLEKGACQIHWTDGGMIRDPKKTASDIKEAIEALLVEQVMSKSNNPLTNSENNAIKEEEHSDSLQNEDTENSDGEK